MLDSIIENNFTYHPPKTGDLEFYENIRNQAKDIAYYIKDNLPDCDESRTALIKLQEAVMWANAARSRN